MHKNIKFELNQEEIVKFQLNLIFNYKNIKFNNTDLCCLTFLFLYGYKNGKKQMEEREITLNTSVWANKISFFRKLGIIEGKGEETKLINKIKIFKDLKKLTILINDSTRTE